MVKQSLSDSKQKQTKTSYSSGGQQCTQEVDQSKNYVYTDDYVTFDIEFTELGNFFHCDILKKEKDTRAHVKRVWIQLQEYLVARGETELLAMIDESDDTLKQFASYYGFKKCDQVFTNEIWIVELR